VESVATPVGGKYASPCRWNAVRPIGSIVHKNRGGPDGRNSRFSGRRNHTLSIREISVKACVQHRDWGLTAKTMKWPDMEGMAAELEKRELLSNWASLTPGAIRNEGCRG
jgi:hypothetical protein